MWFSVVKNNFQFSCPNVHNTLNSLFLKHCILIRTYLLDLWKMTIWLISLNQWRIQDFPEGGIIFKLFAENCMKVKEFGPRGGVPGTLLDPPISTQPKGILKCIVMSLSSVICFNSQWLPITFGKYVSQAKSYIFTWFDKINL